MSLTGRYTLLLEPHASLFIGGYAQAWGQSDGDTASDAQGLLIPGSVVKGALRESALRLVNGAGKGSQMLNKLFGTEGTEGVIQVSPMVPHDPSLGPQENGLNSTGFSSSKPVWEPGPRTHVSLDRATGQAVPGKLFQHRVTPAATGLLFRGNLSACRQLTQDEEGLLRSAVMITDQIGGGRGRGLGLVRLEMSPASQEKSVEVPVLPSEASKLVFALEAVEPLRLGVIKDPSNYVAGKDYLDGSVIRGAVAASLLALLPESIREESAERLLGGPSPAVFGDARPGHPLAITAPLTLREPKEDGCLQDQAVDLCVEHLLHKPLERRFDMRRVERTVIPLSGVWRPLKLKRRTITRTARETVLGRAAEGRLFSTEILDPRPDERGGRLRFYAPVSGTAEQLGMVRQAMMAGISVGGVRSRGFGRLRLVSIEPPALPSLEDRHRRWCRALSKLGVEKPERSGVLLALGPLAVSQERLMLTLEAHQLELIAGAARRSSHGGWISKIHLPRTVLRHFVPGSTFLVQGPDDQDIGQVLKQLEEKGIGPGRADGWGRLVACHPIHLDCRFEEKEGCK